MFTKLRITLSIAAVLGMLVACSPAVPVDLTTPSPSGAMEIPATQEATKEAQPSPLPQGFDCQTVEEIPVVECQALIALYESTNGEKWEDNTGWLANNTPCRWNGVGCAQGHVIELQLFYNRLTGTLPREIGNLPQLKSLYLDDNSLSGPLPAEIGNLTELQVARLPGNGFTSLPAELGRLIYLNELDLSRNQVSGGIPAELGNLSSLQRLTLNSNKFTGSIPAELGRLTNLRSLDLANNQLSGPIPATLGDLAEITELNLSFNQLTGSIPADLGNLTNMYLLDLSYNTLTGEVPADLTSGPMLDLKLRGNQLDGTIRAAAEGIATVNYQGIYFEFPAAVAESVWPEVRAAQPSSQEGPGWEVSPEHVRFTFALPRELGYAALSQWGPSGQTQILIYPTEQFSSMSDFARQEIEELQALLEARPSVPKNEIPFLPLVNAAQVFRAQVEYLEFQNGSGVRFVTQYSQDVMPITNQNLFYTFQGLTMDGAYYISASFPINAAGLTNDPRIDDWDAFSAGYQDYLTEAVSQLDALSSEDFEPDLTLLDQVIQSLRVDALPKR